MHLRSAGDPLGEVVRARRGYSLLSKKLPEMTLLMVDAGGSYAFWKNGYKWALQTSKMLADYGVTWFEEPLKPDAIDDYILLRKCAASNIRRRSPNQTIFSAMATKRGFGYCSA